MMAFQIIFFSKQVKKSQEKKTFIKKKTNKKNSSVERCKPTCELAQRKIFDNPGERTF